MTTYLQPGEMPDFTTADIEGLELTATSSMQDRGYILRYSAGARDAHGKPTQTWTADDEEVRCGYKENSAKELNMDTQQALGDATLRLPLTESFTPLDRFRLTKRMGEEITAEDFTFTGKTTRGPSAIVAQISRLTTKK